MANNKWTKWIVGLSGAVLFTGFIGYLSDHSASGAATGLAGSEYQNGNDSNSLQDQFNSENGSSPDSQNGGSAFGRGYGRHGSPGSFGGDSGQSDSGQSDSGTDGSMRTRGS